MDLYLPTSLIPKYMPGSWSWCSRIRKEWGFSVELDGSTLDTWWSVSFGWFADVLFTPIFA